LHGKRRVGGADADDQKCRRVRPEWPLV
jgi:hypothetical protein